MVKYLLRCPNLFYNAYLNLTFLALKHNFTKKYNLPKITKFVFSKYSYYYYYKKYFNKNRIIFRRVNEDCMYYPI